MFLRNTFFFFNTAVHRSSLCQMEFWLYDGSIFAHLLLASLFNTITVFMNLKGRNFIYGVGREINRCLNWVAFVDIFEVLRFPVMFSFCLKVLPCTLNFECKPVSHYQKTAHFYWPKSPEYMHRFRTFSTTTRAFEPLSNPILIHSLLVEYFLYIRATSIRIKPISTLSLQTANWICSRLLINSRADWHIVRSFAYRDLLTSPSACLRAWHRAKSQSGNWLWREEGSGGAGEGEAAANKETIWNTYVNECKKTPNICMLRRITPQILQSSWLINKSTVGTWSDAVSLRSSYKQVLIGSKLVARRRTGQIGD